MSSSVTASSSLASNATSVPALTTTFTPASSCTVDVYQYSYTLLDDWVCVAGTSEIACIYYHLGRTTSDAACFPKGWSPGTVAYFSPGICPVGYSQACSTVADEQTLATCCPLGYSCQTKFTDYSFYTSNLCTSQMPYAELFVYTTSIAGKGDTVSTISKQEGLNANGMRISYNAADFATTSTTATASSTASTSVPTSYIEPTGTSNASSGLSKGATAGIGVGVSLGALAVIGGLVFLFLRHRKKALAGCNQGSGAGDAGLEGPASQYADVPIGSPDAYNMETKRYGTPSPGLQLPSPPPPQYPQYAEVSGESYITEASELTADNVTRR